LTEAERKKVVDTLIASTPMTEEEELAMDKNAPGARLDNSYYTHSLADTGAIWALLRDHNQTLSDDELVKKMSAMKRPGFGKKRMYRIAHRKRTIDGSEETYFDILHKDIKKRKEIQLFRSRRTREVPAYLVPTDVQRDTTELERRFRMIEGVALTREEEKDPKNLIDGVPTNTFLTRHESEIEAYYNHIGRTSLFKLAMDSARSRYEIMKNNAAPNEVVFYAVRNRKTADGKTEPFIQPVKSARTTPRQA
jgi:hypothetical protein